jgi:CBS domain-containing protein
VTETSLHSPEELRMIVEQSEVGGTIQPQDAELIEGVFEFSEKNAREVMTPRTEVVAMPVEATLDEACAIVEESNFSRYPVYDGSLDNVVGIVLAKDLLRVMRHADAGFELTQILRDALVVPGSREVEEVLSDFKRRKEHMAVVLDEFGGTAGIVTMEDLRGDGARSSTNTMSRATRSTETAARCRAISERRERRFGLGRRTTTRSAALPRPRSAAGGRRPRPQAGGVVVRRWMVGGSRRSPWTCTGPADAPRAASAAPRESAWPPPRCDPGVSRDRRTTRTDFFMLPASAIPCPAMPAPFHGREVRGKGSPRVTFTACPNDATLMAVIPTSWYGAMTASKAPRIARTKTVSAG